MGKWRYLEKLRAERITCVDEGFVLLCNAHFNVLDHEVVGLCGLDNSGKRTLVECVSGLRNDYAGRIWHGELLYRPENIGQARETGVYLIQERSSLIGAFTVNQNLQIVAGALRAKTRGRAYRECCARTLREICPQVDPSALVQDLAYADQVAVEIVKAVLGNADIIILDEVLSKFPQYALKDFDHVLTQLRHRDISVVLSESSVGVIRPFADRLYILRKGGNAALLGREAMGEEAMAALMTGEMFHDLHVLARPQNLPIGHEPILEFQGVCLGSALRGLSFQVRQYEILGLLNNNKHSGALVEEVLRRTLQIDGGTILYRGRPIEGMSIAQKQRMGLFLIPENTPLFTNFSVASNVGISALSRFRRKGYLINEAELKYEISETIGDFFHEGSGDLGLYDPVPRSRIAEKKLAICRALVAGAQLIICRNAAQNLDLHAVNALLQAILKLRQLRITLVLIDSDVDFLAKVCDRILVLSGGKAIAEFGDTPYSVQQLRQEYCQHIGRL